MTNHNLSNKTFFDDLIFSVREYMCDEDYAEIYLNPDVALT